AQVDGPEHVGSGVEQRIAYRHADVDLSRKVVDDVRVRPQHDALQLRRRDVEVMKPKPFRARPLYPSSRCEIVRVARAESVDADALVPLREESVDKIRPDESSSTGNQASHHQFPPISVAGGAADTDTEMSAPVPSGTLQTISVA